MASYVASSHDLPHPVASCLGMTHAILFYFRCVLHHRCNPVSLCWWLAVFHGRVQNPAPRSLAEHILEMENMNRRVMQNKTCETVAWATWEGMAIMGSTDGSVQDPIATYSFVISISRTDVKLCVKGGGFLPPPRLLSIRIRIQTNVPKRRRSLLD
jgi:hypothetical protein